MLTRIEDRLVASGAGRSRLARARSVGWIGQTVASLCWISSMLAYGVESGGDWLQVCAASSWLLANIATLIKAGPESAEDAASRHQRRQPAETRSLEGGGRRRVASR